MIKVRTEEVMVEQEVGYEYVCDECQVAVESKCLPKGWFELKAGHSEWGNDSFESIKYSELCSPKCLHEMMKDKRGDNYYSSSFMEIGKMDNKQVDALLDYIEKSGR